MKSIFESVTSKNYQNAAAIKDNLTTLLKETVAQLMLSKAGIESETEGAADLCAIVEAIFLNGLKDGFMNRFRRTLDVDQQCTLSFWSLLMEISHQENIKQVAKLSIIKTEVGQCRSWIRIVLNEALLSSYMKTIKENRKTLLRYYQSYAYLLDIELVDIAQILLEKLEAITIHLPCNSGILNTWMDLPLSLAGIAYRPMRLNQIAQGFDIAQTITASSSKNSETCSNASSILSQSSGIGQMVHLNEDEALRMILKGHSDKEESDESSSKISEVQTEKIHVQGNNILGNHSGWSFDAENCEKAPLEENSTEENKDTANICDEIETETTEGNCSKCTLERSYSSIIESNLLDLSHIRTPDFREVLHRLGAQLNAADASKSDEEHINEAEIKVIGPSRTKSIHEQVTRLGNEQGLDQQDYKCNSCEQQLLIANKIAVCSFSGQYFCDSCMAAEEMAIPARIINNWDYKKYPVSQYAFNCLNEIKDEPIIDFKQVNPFIYSVVDDMARLQTLRNQLNYLRAYLYTCREPVIEQLQKMMYPKEYMYEHIHQYSITDLLLIKNGELASQLEKVVQFGREHVLNCWLCSQKGFVCEICHDRKALFPFDTDNVYRCNKCSGVSHKTCLNATKPCPRCKRKLQRDFPHQDATLEQHSPSLS